MGHAKQNYLAIIGDLVASRQMEPEQRNAVQKRFHAILDEINREFREDIASLFLITAGDETQGILLHPQHCYEILRKIQLALSPTQIVFGLGIGEITTELGEYAVGSDGPALHRARQALTEAKQERKAYGKAVLREVKICSDDTLQDTVLNALYLSLSVFRHGWSEKQRRIVHSIEQGHGVKQTSERLHVPQSNVSRTVDAVHLREYEEIVRAVRAVFQEQTRDIAFLIK